jgi:hypothetical protein
MESNMSNGNRNSATWRSKLDELESLPGEIMPDKNAAWDKLHSRLATKRNNNKKVTWYWTAAACVLFALMIPTFVTNKREAQLTTTTIKQNLSRVKTPARTLIEKDVLKENVRPAKKSEIISVRTKNEKLNSKTIPQETSNEIRLYDTVSSHSLMKENVNIISQPADTLSYIASALPVKKKLKVVHINELGDPVEISPDIAGKKDLHSFQLKLARQEAYTNPSVAFNKNGFTIFKTKSSPN